MRFTIGSILVATIAVAVALAGFRLFGTNGIAPVCTVVSVTWFIFSRIPSGSLYPINRERLTVGELIVLVGIGLILHGLFLPTVQSGPHRRRSTITAPASLAPTTTEADADEL